MANRKLFFIAAAPVLLLLGMTLSFRILSQLTVNEPEPTGNHARTAQRLPRMEAADTATQEALKAAVQGQLSAIRKGDYGDALTYSEPSFRASWNPKQFQEMIETGYKEMTEAVKEEFQTGQVADNIAHLRVVITTDDNMRMGYLYYLTRDGDRWYVQTCSSGFPMGYASQNGETPLSQPGRPQSGPPLAPKL